MRNTSGHRFFYLALGLIVIGMVSAEIGAVYYFEKMYGVSGSKSAGSCNGLTADGMTIGNLVAIDTLINYGNGTMEWYNETEVPSGWNFYQLTLYIARCNVVASFDTALNEHYVTGINGLANRGHSYWTLWILCENTAAWIFANVGADLIRLSNGQTLAWAYETLSSPNPAQPPEPGTSIVNSCA